MTNRILKLLPFVLCAAGCWVSENAGIQGDAVSSIKIANGRPAAQRLTIAWEQSKGESRGTAWTQYEQAAPRAVRPMVYENSDHGLVEIVPFGDPGSFLFEQNYCPTHHCQMKRELVVVFVPTAATGDAGTSPVEFALEWAVVVRLHPNSKTVGLSDIKFTFEDVELGGDGGIVLP